MKKAEADMVEWLEKTDNDLEAADSMGEEYLVEYVKVMDLPQAIQNVKTNAVIRQTISSSDKEEIEEATAWFLVRGTKDIKLTEILLKENEINYERK